MNQRTLAGFERYGKVTRRAQFLADMERVMPWDKLIGLIRPHYPTMGEQGGRPPIPLERMLRVYCLQLWFNLSDPAAEEALYDSDTMRRFVGVDLGSEAPPDETTICKFRHLLEKHDMSGRVLKVVNRHLASRGIKVSNGTMPIPDPTALLVHQPLQGYFMIRRAMSWLRLVVVNAPGVG